jgi:hypothetical protein
MTINNFDPIELPRFQENGAGRFAKTFLDHFDDSNLTMAQIIFIEEYFKNVSEKGLW